MSDTLKKLLVLTDTRIMIDTDCNNNFMVGGEFDTRVNDSITTHISGRGDTLEAALKDFLKKQSYTRIIYTKNGARCTIDVGNLEE
jgi:hypothetical protein